MAKKSKETNVPLIFALVFFILTTIAFGVMWYLSYSDMETKNGEVKKAQDELKSQRNIARENELKGRVYRLYMGLDLDPEDKTTIANEAKAGDAISTELDRVNAAMAKKLGVADVASLPEDFKFWTTDANKKANAPPAEGLADQVAKLNKKADEGYKTAEAERDAYKRQVDAMKTAIGALDSVKKKFQGEIDRLPAEFKNELKKVTDGFDKRTLDYQQNEAKANASITALSEERDKLLGQVRRMDKQLEELKQNNQQLAEKVNKGDKERLTFDEPQGKILRKLPEGAVEISLGSAAGVRPGLTFTVLPSDFPQKGRQSRMRMLRVPDGKGGYKSVESFVPRGAIEVYEVVGPNLSLARIQSGSELDPIRDGVAVGDLLYNSAWRKGVADHIALIGIFDVNGDGTDDIVSVVRDLTKMGIPVDAYYDMKKRAWVGQITERTRYIVEGLMPINSATDPHRDEKTKLLGAISTAINEGKQKGIEEANYRDFFSRMGYKFRLDVSDDKVNQATAPYLSNVGVGNTLTPPENP